MTTTNLSVNGIDAVIELDKINRSLLSVPTGRVLYLEQQVDSFKSWLTTKGCEDPDSTINNIIYRHFDEVLYRKGDEAAKQRAEAVSKKMDEMAKAYGHTITADFSVGKYIDEKLHRSSTASVATLAGIPALTAELSSSYTPLRATVNAGTAGLRNVMRWAGMLPGAPEPITGIRIVDPGFPTRRRSAARVSEACFVHHLVEAGTLVRIGDPLVEMRDAWGRVLGVLRSEYDGFVISCPSGILYYPGEASVLLAIRDDEPAVGEYPADFFD